MPVNGFGMFGAIGLALDIVGAVVLLVGLFARERGVGGLNRTPQDVASDWALGIVGGAYLVAGLILQSLASFDVRHEVSGRAAFKAWLLCLAVGLVYAWIAHTGLAANLAPSRERVLLRRQAQEAARRDS